MVRSRWGGSTASSCTGRVNDQGELFAFCLTPGYVDDWLPVPKLVKRLFGKLFDKDYLSQPLMEELLVTQGVHLITKLRKKMRNRLMDMSDKLLLRKRAISETIVDQLKNICQIEHSHHRSPINFLINLVAGLIAYCHQPKKPSLGLRPVALAELELIPNSRYINAEAPLPHNPSSDEDKYESSRSGASSSSKWPH